MSRISFLYRNRLSIVLITLMIIFLQDSFLWAGKQKIKDSLKTVSLF